MSPILFDSLKTKKRKGKYILHNSYKSDVFSLGFCMLLAATLKVESLYVIRDILCLRFDIMEKRLISSYDEESDTFVGKVVGEHGYVADYGISDDIFQRRRKRKLSPMR